MTENKKPGVEVRRQVMGDAFVDRALGNATEFTQPLQDFVNEHAWGGVWNREGLLFLGLYLAYGLHVVSFTTGMPLAGKLEHLMLFFVLPALVAYLLFTSLRAWRRQHHNKELP